MGNDEKLAYVVCKEVMLIDFIRSVNTFIDEGYEPAGGVLLLDAGEFYSGFYCQAMYKAPTKKPSNHAVNDIIGLGLSRWSLNRLEEQCIDIDKLRTMSEIDLLKLPRFGRQTVNEILSALWRDGGMK